MSIDEARDDALLDLLGRGEPAPADDSVAAMLAAWRADLDTPPEESVKVRPPIPIPVTASRRRWRPSRMLLVAAAMVLAFAGGLAVAARSAGPDSPLWPVTRIMYGDHASSMVAQRQAESAIARAREAIAQNHYTDAARLLDEASVLIGQIRDPAAAQRLLDEVAAVRGLLPGGVAPASGLPGGTGTGGGSSSGGGTGSNPAPSATGGGLPLPLPSLPVPLPTLQLPSLPVATTVPPLFP